MSIFVKFYAFIVQKVPKNDITNCAKIKNNIQNASKRKKTL